MESSHLQSSECLGARLLVIGAWSVFAVCGASELFRAPDLSLESVVTLVFLVFGLGAGIAAALNRSDWRVNSFLAALAFGGIYLLAFAASAIAEADRLQMSVAAAALRKEQARWVVLRYMFDMEGALSAARETYLQYGMVMLQAWIGWVTRPGTWRNLETLVP